MNTAQFISTNLTKEYKVQLKGAYEGKYRVFTILGSDSSSIIVFTDTERLIHIHNQDIIDLVVEAINQPIE
jgi:hypothetical protein